MPSDLYWIDHAEVPRLAIMARPRAGDWLEDEVAHWSRSGVEIVVSLLEALEIDDLDLRAEPELCAQSGIEFIRFPIPDRGLPDDRVATMRFSADIAARGKPIPIHCRAGIGRSSIIAAAILISQGVDPQAALSAISGARGAAWRSPIPMPNANGC